MGPDLTNANKTKKSPLALGANKITPSRQQAAHYPFYLDTQTLCDFRDVDLLCGEPSGVRSAELFHPLEPFHPQVRSMAAAMTTAAALPVPTDAALAAARRRRALFAASTFISASRSAKVASSRSKAARGAGAAG